MPNDEVLEQISVLAKHCEILEDSDLIQLYFWIIESKEIAIREVFWAVETAIQQKRRFLTATELADLGVAQVARRWGSKMKRTSCNR